jgi:hypothetical protein
MWKLSFYHGTYKYEYDIEFTDKCSERFFSGTTKKGKRIIWSGNYLLEKIPEEPLTN